MCINSVCVFYILPRLIILSLCQPSVSTERCIGKGEDGGVCLPHGAQAQPGDSQPKRDGSAA